MTLGKVIKAMFEKREANIFGKLYSVAGRNEYDLFIQAANSVADKFDGTVKSWVNAANEAVAKNQFPNPVLKVESAAFKYYSEKSFEAEKASCNKARHLGFINFFRDKVSAIMHSKHYSQNYSEVEAVKARIKLALFLDAAICAFDTALETLFSEENVAETEAQLRFVFKDNDSVINQPIVLAILEQRRAVMSLIEKVYAGEAIDANQVHGYESELFKLYEVCSLKVENTFEMLEKLDCLPIQAFCTYFSHLSTEIPEEEREVLFTLKMY